MRVLDEVAAAINLARYLPLVSEVGLEELFRGPLAPKQWATIQHHLDCGLPPLVFVHGHWFLPDGFETIWDLADYVADAHPDWDPPEEYSVAEWRNAQIFVRVRVTLVECYSVQPEDVTRDTRLIDLE
jgi:hypothetical protein